MAPVGESMLETPLITRPIEIGQNVFMGYGVVVLKGVTIGDRAVIGAGAVVTKDVDPGETVVGPAAQPFGQYAEQRFVLLNPSSAVPAS